MAIIRADFGPVVERTVNPTVNDDLNAEFGVGAIWINTITDDVFIAADVSIGAAVWRGPYTDADAIAAVPFALYIPLGSAENGSAVTP